MERRRAEEHVAREPAEIDDAAAHIAAGLKSPEVGRVGDEQQHDASAEQQVGGGSLVRAHQDAKRDREQEHISQRIGKRDQSPGRRQCLVMRDRAHDEEPGGKREAGRDRRRIDERRPVPTGSAGADQEHESGAEKRVAAQVADVRNRREGARMRDVLLVGEQEVTDDKRELARGKQEPRTYGARTVEVDADPYRQHGAQADQLRSEPVARGSGGNQRIGRHCGCPENEV